MIRLPFHIISCAILCLTLASCGSHLSITKRHYSPGYYVDYGRHNPSNEVIKPNEPQEKLSNEWLNASSNDKLDLHSNSSILPKAKVEANSISANSGAKLAEAPSEKSAKRKPFQEIAIVKKVQKALSQTTSIKSATAAPHDGLSLLWLVILIIILLWLLGYLFGGFGLGPLIHLLLLIALILLILWLLRII